MISRIRGAEPPHKVRGLRKPLAYQAGELRVGTFTPKVTFRAAIDRFEHLITLGIADAPGKLVVLGVAIVLGGFVCAAYSSSAGALCDEVVHADRTALGLELLTRRAPRPAVIEML